MPSSRPDIATPNRTRESCDRPGVKPPAEINSDERRLTPYAMMPGDVARALISAARARALIADARVVSWDADSVGWPHDGQNGLRT